MTTLAATREVRDWMIWFLKLRVVIYTVILGILIGVERVATPTGPFASLLGVVVVALLLTLVFSLWLYFSKDYLLQAVLQILSDLVIITLILYLTGGSDSYFSILFLLPISFCSLVFYLRGALLTAFSATLMHTTVLWLAYVDVIPSYSLARTAWRPLLTFIALNTLMFFVVGYFSGSLAENLRHKGAELVDKTDALANLKALNENIIQSMRGGLLTTDRLGRVALLNAAGEEILERRASQVVGGLIQEAFPEIPFKECVDQLSNDRLNVRIDSVLTTTSGSEKFLGLSVSQLYNDRRASIGYVINFQDLTELRRLEREVRAKDRMAALGEMAAGIAHEIRNPLASIAGSVALLKGEVPLNEEQAKLMSIVSHESQRLNKIINDFLIYSKQVTFHPRTVDLVELMEDTVTLLQNNPQVTEWHQIEKHADKRPLPCVLDPDLIKQVFWNVSHNAIRAMPRGGTLTIQLKTPVADEVQIIFRDTGVGIPADKIDKIFEPFHSFFADGTGLGLAIVYQIVQTHHGRIDVHSAVGEGTVFEISLPRQTVQ